ncbi:flagellar basal body rod protein FlgC [Haliovirga abyssi]|uniref:Flagellar basal-body rod protein FlgC n=1 Tax=Haliovirga abyssi TaxID=2996794 RepID=A0AAU9D3E6_9FUSO|nr:flagellar basal body rod protein FlgC [Haliovirga abyssi]BDU50486.1 flagellar basal-body rod protein FlgC [Haliovirga abyssi]
MGIFGIINTSASGLTAERLRMDVISENIANANTTVTKNGTPYRRKEVIFQARKNTEFKIPMNMSNENDSEIGNGVRVLKIAEDKAPFKYVYNPNHPNANKDGYVAMPNVNIVKEMTDMITATRAYEANVTVINSAKGMANSALSIGK